MKIEGAAAEFNSTNNSVLLDQFVDYTIGELSKAIRGDESEMIACAKRIDDGANQDLTLKRVRFLKSILTALEGDNLGQVQLKRHSSPMVIRTSDDFEITILVFFSVSGKRVHSGIMTMQVIHPRANQEGTKFEGGLRLGHIGVSEAGVVEK